MCGICGEIKFDARAQSDAEMIRAMCATILHRGPDEQRIHMDGRVGLGSTRLAIIDVVGGHMPLANEDGTVWIVYNGETYNFARLREWLERAGHVFATHSDTETIVHLYEQEGDAFVRHLNGMFALAIWDARRRRLVLARDHVGIKPLYYAELDDRLVFGSELKPLLVNGMSREIDALALHDYLSLNYVPGPRTIFARAKKLLPGHLLVFDADTCQTQITRYWDVPLPTEYAIPPRARNLESALLELLQIIVQDQMVSDVPLGAFLSGGIDSSLVVALMSRVSARPVQTFSVGFHDKSYDESPYARLVAETFKTDHHELVMEPRATDVVTTMSEYFDEPFADPSAAAVYVISGLAKQHVKVALSGDGGDELFGGYYTYQADKIAMWYRRLPRAIGTGLVPALVNRMPVSAGKASLDFKAKRFVTGGSLPPLPAHVAWKAFMSEEMKTRLYEGTAFQHGTPRASALLFQEYYDGYATKDLVNRMLYVDTKIQLPDDMLTKVDRASMAHSLEVRVPLLDLRLVEFMAQLPGDNKVRGLQLKYLLKRVAAQVLPRAILRRPKAGFNIPLARWLNTDLRATVEQHLSARAIEAQGMLNAQVIAEIIAAHQSGKYDYSRSIWNLLMFSMWFERHAQPNRAVDG